MSKLFIYIQYMQTTRWNGLSKTTIIYRCLKIADPSEFSIEQFTSIAYNVNSYQGCQLWFGTGIQRPIFPMYLIYIDRFQFNIMHIQAKHWLINQAFLAPFYYPRLFYTGISGCLHMFSRIQQNKNCTFFALYRWRELLGWFQ